MEEKDNGIDASREIVPLQALYGFVDTVLAQNIMNVRLHSSIHEYLDGVLRIYAAVPTHSDRPAIFPADGRQFRRKPIAGGGEVGNQAVFPADLKKLFKALVLVRVAPPAQGKLVCPAPALLRDPSEIVYCHIGLFRHCAVLVAADSRFPAQPCFPMDTVPHHPHVDEMRERCHKGVCACIAAFFDYAASNIGSCFVIEQSYEMVFGVYDFMLHLFTVLLLRNIAI